MSAFFFLTPALVDLDALHDATIGGELVLQVMTVSDAEVALAKRDGPQSLLDVLERNAVPPFLDFARSSCI